MASDVTGTLDMALSAAGLDQVQVVHRPRRLTDNASSYVAGELADRLGDWGMTHIRGVPRHPRTQGKIERCHQTLGKRILLEYACPPGELEARMEAFVEHYNGVRAHESLRNLTAADVYLGRGDTILRERERIKRQTLTDPRLRHYAQSLMPTTRGGGDETIPCRRIRRGATGSRPTPDLVSVRLGQPPR